MKSIADHNFTAVANDAGYYVGRCREFPDLRSAPRKNRLDAIDDIIAKVVDKLRALQFANDS